MIKAVFFDMDGTLVDTEGIDNKVAVELCKELGFELTQEEQKERHGRTTKSFYEYLSKKRNTNFNVQKAIENQLAGFEKELKRGVKGFAGAREIPKMLAFNGYELAIVSGSTTSQINIVLQTLGINNFFKVIVSADDIVHSKPDPEGYLLAAKKLKILPEECVVIEDGTKGVQAGKNAGMKVVGVTHHGGQDLSLADITIAGLENITLEMLHSLL